VIIRKLYRTYRSWSRPKNAPMTSQKSHAEAEMEAAMMVRRTGQNRIRRIRRRK
jgi:hypothetical protein